MYGGLEDLFHRGCGEPSEYRRLPVSYGLMSALLRRAGVDDAPVIAGCVKRAYAKYEGRLPRPPKPVLADYAAVVRASPTWLLEDDGQCVGVLVLVPGADHLLLENVAVDPAQQGRGLGRRLLDFAEAEARRLGLPEVRLYTNALMTENIGIYAARGYVETERREIDGRAAVFMRKSVEER
jgi:ribosomal protein S18 acetylase RimI-like enzyme